MRKFIRNSAVMACLSASVGLVSAARSEHGQLPRNLEQKIEKAIANDESLQPSSRHIKVTIHNYVVTLKGTVQNEVETQDILGDAESEVIAVLPDDSIESGPTFDNQLVVAGQ